jgi:hypothetical protein
MSWFDSQLQLLQYCHWKLRKSRLTVSITNLLVGCHQVSNVTFCLRQEVILLFFFAFLNRSCWAEKECHLSLLEQSKNDRAKNQHSFTSFVYKNANKILKTRKANFSGRLLSQVASI